ncbi:MAG: transcriptional regulator, SarA/Rot family [Candidatus Baldrarchaeia archaeon]
MNEKKFNFPPSTWEVYRIIKEKKVVTSKDIINETTYSPRTVRNALKMLLEAGLIRRIPNLEDARQYLYVLNEKKREKKFA